MSLMKLSHTSALGQGSDLWIVPSTDQSIWARKVDWYMNLQMSRARQHNTSELAEPLKNLLTENEIHWSFKMDRAKAPLMVISSTHLPSKSVVELKFNGNAKQWIADCEALWNSLSQPTVRLFLPDEVSSQDLANHWPKSHLEGVSYVTAN